MLSEHLDHPLRRSVSLAEQHDPGAVGDPAPDVGDRPLDVAAVLLGRADVDRPAGIVGVVVEAERTHAPPGLALREHVLPYVADLAQRRGAEVDRGLATTGGGRPARAEELLGRRHQVVGSRAHPLGIEQEHVALRRQQVDQHLHLVDQHRGEGLHALDCYALGHPVGELGQLGVLGAERLGPAAYVVGEQELAARRRPEPLDRLEGALVGDRERADLVDVVAEELHPQRVLLGGREDVDDAAAHRELAALLDQVDAGVRRVGEPSYDVVEVGAVADGELDRLQVGQPLHLRLQHRADRRHHHVERAVALVGARVAQPAQHGQPAPDGVAAGAEPFVRERLPRRVVADPGGIEHVTQHLDQVLGLARGRGDHQHGAPGVDQALDHERPQRSRTGQVERREPAAVGHRLGEDGVAQDEVGQTGDAQRVLLETGWGHTTNAPSRRGQGVWWNRGQSTRRVLHARPGRRTSHDGTGTEMMDQWSG